MLLGKVPVTTDVVFVTSAESTRVLDTIRGNPHKVGQGFKSWIRQRIFSREISFKEYFYHHLVLEFVFNYPVSRSVYVSVSVGSNRHLAI